MSDSRKKIILIAAIFGGVCILVLSLFLIVRTTNQNRLNQNHPVDTQSILSEITSVRQSENGPEKETKSDPESESVSESKSETESEPESKKAEPESPDPAKESPYLSACTVGEYEGLTYGIDVSQYQGNIDWATVAANGVEFAIIRIGYSGTVYGGIGEDPYAKRNLEEAEKNGVKIGIYFYSSAISEEEAKREADWIAEYISPYSITYPIAIDCEGFEKESHRQHVLSQEERSNVVMAFMDRVYENGYTPMIYGDITAFENDAKWDTSRIEQKYKIWLANYKQDRENLEQVSDYTGQCSMLQYSCHGRVEGIPAEVDLDVAYFGYNGVEKPKKEAD